MADNHSNRKAIGTPVKDLFKDAVQRQTGLTNISVEQIKQAFVIIDAHTKILDQTMVLNNLNSTVQIISTLAISCKDEWFNKENSEELFKNLCNQYFNVFIDTDTNNNTEVQKNVRDFVINSCMIYYAVHSMSKEMLKKYNSLINEALAKILKINSPKAEKKEHQNNVVDINLAREKIEESKNNGSHDDIVE